jgi:anti-sigma B factor antagonist
MDVTTRQRGDVTVLDLAGRLTVGEGQRALRDAVARALEQGSRSLLLCCGAVVAIDSTGMGALVKAYTAAAQGGARLKLCCVAASTREILRRMHLLSLLDAYKDEDAALRAFDAANRARS